MFDAAAADYARYRPGIPEEAVRLLAETLEGIRRPALLDLGTGTGQVPAALLPAAPQIARVDLVDPDRDMLREATAVLRPSLGDRPSAFHPVRAEEFTPPCDGYQAHLITCARSIHPV
ncbi:hypothetical protein [Streptomyces sp. NPDC058583]|uniref:hypothetical protein n=1 Tax=unclassified Streptomyces TaxID=2593676 RepID=UPI00365B67CA